MPYALASLALFLFLLSCTNEQIPQDRATPEERQLVDHFLLDIQQKLVSLNVNVDILKLPVIITDDVPGGNWATCHPSSHIRISRTVIHFSKGTQGNDPLWQTLAHEIGHCYFFRPHEEKTISAPPGYFFRLINSYKYNGKLFCFDNFTQSIPGTLMATEVRNFSNSKELQIYLLKELTGLIDGNEYHEFIQETGIDLVKSSQIPKITESKPCN